MPEIVCRRITVTGVVQGVGFRPFVYRLAAETGLAGWVNNATQGVFIEVEGVPHAVETFIRRLETEKPPRALIQSVTVEDMPPSGQTVFVIRKSDAGGDKTTLILPDVATCPDCLRECFDPQNRRYLYPFTNCTNCGPRYSIIEALPYDRPNTSMKHFTLCDACREEYENPLDRRFHAQPNACPVCGPHLALWTPGGETLASHHDALLQAAAALERGAVVALKGLGGFQLLVDARSDSAVQRLRARKHRDEKPFALMYPTLEMAQAHCDVSELEAALLCSPEAPIVLLRRRTETCPEGIAPQVAPQVAPDNPYLGVMLPYTPLHHLLMAQLGFPVVATSGNLSGEPICTDEYNALKRLGEIADVFLVHDRPIVRHVDDSIVRVMGGRSMMLRRARGYAPLPITVKNPLPPVLAVGAHLKNTVAIAIKNHLFIGQHIGDLETAGAFEAFRRTIDTLQTVYEFQPEIIAHDMHPDYLSTQYARETAEENPDVWLFPVQHHYAHVLACMADNSLEGAALGIAWDGTGYGTDGTVWGGEFLLIPGAQPGEAFQRVAHLRAFRLPGGDKAVIEPRRSAVGLLYEIFGDETFTRDDVPPVAAFTAQERRILQTMLQKGLNAPQTTSVGRLFDAIAALVGLQQVTNYEGQAAMKLEWAMDENTARHAPTYGYRIDDAPLVVDWQPMVLGILDDVRVQVPIGEIAARFHNTLVEIMVDVAGRVGEKRVLLTGGCFQNRYLTERAILRLCDSGFDPYWHRDLPPNDGGIAPGQVLACVQHETEPAGGLS